MGKVRIAVCLPSLRHLTVGRAALLTTRLPGWRRACADLLGARAASHVREHWKQPSPEPLELSVAAPRADGRKHAHGVDAPAAEDQREREHAPPRDDQLEAWVVAAEEEAVRRHARELERTAIRCLAPNEPGDQLVREDLGAAGEICLDGAPELCAVSSADHTKRFTRAQPLDGDESADVLQPTHGMHGKALSRRWRPQRRLQTVGQSADRSAQPEPEEEREHATSTRARRSGHKEILLWWAASRVLVISGAVVVQLFGWPRASWHPSLLRHPLALLGIWDGRWYALIADHGYLLIPGRQSDPAFFPLYPIMLAGLHELGLTLLLGGLLLSNLGFLVGLLALYELGRWWLPERDARRAAIYAAVFPAGYVFSMAYPEGVVFAALALASLFALRERWLACAVCAAAATLARPEGLFVALPICAIVARRWPLLPSLARGRALAAALAAPIALASFLLYLWVVLGDPLAWMAAERAWGRGVEVTGIARAGFELATSVEHDKGWLFRDAAFTAVYLASLWVALRARIPRSWVAAGGLIVLLPLLSGSFTSDARFGLLALPVYFGLGVLGRASWFNHAFLVVSPLLLVAGVFTLLMRFP